MPESTFNHPLFGEIHFRTVSQEWKRGDKIVFLSGFDTSVVEPLTIPQLGHIPGASKGKLKVHRSAHAQLLRAFSLIESQGLLHHVKTCAGTLNARLRKPTSGALSKLPSNHAFGIAIDLNEDDPGFGDSVAPLAPFFESMGFTWGKAFNDPMHFEVNRFLTQEELHAFELPLI
ncbi:M15 family metallopeptidase [Pseudomonas thivervalensis]|uniref:M15 family metallopeptidase n=1 Tax=Pseudomonas thivervalensis TaxID=86265 RepID=UPI00069E361A|nr:M15 family metallopeptidase [Pseudomonas thivervalensis]